MDYVPHLSCVGFHMLGFLEEHRLNAWENWNVVGHRCGLSGGGMDVRVTFWKLTYLGEAEFWR